jgi:signal transduction histidine kinase
MESESLFRSNNTKLQIILMSICCFTIFLLYSQITQVLIKVSDTARTDSNISTNKTADSTATSTIKLISPGFLSPGLRNYVSMLQNIEKTKQAGNENRVTIQSREAHKQRLYNFLFIPFSFIMALLLVTEHFYWRHKRKQETKKWLTLQRKKELESQMRLREERTRIAGEMHDDLGSTLTSTIMALELIRQHPGEPLLLAMVDRSAHQLSDQINEIIWNMNVRNDTLESLSTYILNFAATFLTTASIALSWNEHLTKENVWIEGHKRRNIFISTKELINNIVKHSQASRVQLNITYREGTLTIDINDNGIGFQKNDGSGTTGLGNGLCNIKKRIESIDGTIIWQNADPGTDVHLSIRL